MVISALIIFALVYGGYELGRRHGNNKLQSIAIKNDSFVRELASLATLDVNGVSTFASTEIVGDHSLPESLLKILREQRVVLSAPFKASFGVDLNKNSLTILQRDTIIEIHLPAPMLLSYDLRLERLENKTETGETEGYMRFRKNLYDEGKRQQEENNIYLTQSASKISQVLENYFKTFDLQAVCIFDLPGTVIVPASDTAWH